MVGLCRWPMVRKRRDLLVVCMLLGHPEALDDDDGKLMKKLRSRHGVIYLGFTHRHSDHVT